MSASVKGKPSLSDSDAEKIAISLKEAFKGIGTDEARIIKELLSVTNAQRQIVKEKYKNLYGKTLEEDLKDELHAQFEDICVALLLPRFEFEARTIRNAMEGIGSRDSIIIDLLCTKEPAEIQQLKNTYNTLFGRDFEDDLKGEAEGPLERLYRSIAAGNRPSGNNVDQGLAQSEAQELYDAGEGHWGTEEGIFVRVLVSRSFAQLRATFDAYQRLTGKDIEDAIKGETEGDLEEALVAIVRTVRNRPAYFARRLQSAMRGPGTNDRELIEILVSRSEIDMITIRQEYKKLYSRSLTEDLKSELSGHYEAIVLKLLGKE